MNRADLTADLARRAGIAPEQARRSLESLFGNGEDPGLIAEALAGGDTVRLTGFGTFEARPRAARRAANPQTGKPLLVPASIRAVFRAGSQLKQVLQVGGGSQKDRGNGPGPEPKRSPGRSKARRPVG